MEKDRSPGSHVTRSERGIPDGPAQWESSTSVSRDIVMIYPAGSSTIDAPATPGGEVPGSLSSARGKSPRPTRPPSIQSIPEHHEIVANERLHVRKHPKSPKKAKLSVPSDETAGKLGHSRLRTTTTSRSRGHSPSTPRGHIEEDELQDVLAEIIRDQTLTLARAARRHSKTTTSRSQAGGSSTKDSQQDTPLARNSIHSSGRSSAPSVTAVVEAQDESLVKVGVGRRTKTRRQKRKVDTAQDPLADGDVPAAAATCCEERRTSSPGFKPLSGLQQFVSRVRTRKGGNHESSYSTSKSSWMQLFGDIILWKNVSRSALLFGAGCFFILSSSFVQDVRCGALTFTAYMALIYLGVVFVHRNFLRGGSSQPLGKNWELCESDALEVLKKCLPATNVALRKCGELFCGEPSITLKVASILWLLAQAGYFMTIWSFARLSFLLMFIVPKLYLCYSYQLHGQVEASVDRLRKAWSAYAHKKVALFVSFILAWNLSSATSRLYGAFLLLVAFKLYTRQLAEQASNQAEVDPHLPVSEPAANIKSITAGPGTQFRSPQERRKKGLFDGS